MPTWRPDPTFYPSPRSAMRGPGRDPGLRRPRQSHRRWPAGCHRRRRRRSRPPAPTVSSSGEVEMTHAGDELHHFGWNACSSMLCPNAPHPHVERRYLDRAGARLLAHLHHRYQARPDTAPASSRRSKPEEMAAKTGYANGHTVHCGPDGIYVSALGAPDGGGPGRHLHARPRHLRRAGPLGDRARRPVAALRLLVASRLRHVGQQRVGHPEHGAERGAAGAATRRPVRAPPALLGSPAAPPSADARSGQRTPDRPRAAAGARPDEGLRLRQLRRQPDRSLLHRSSSGTARTNANGAKDSLGSDEGHHHPRRAGG